MTDNKGCNEWKNTWVTADIRKERISISRDKMVSVGEGEKRENVIEVRKLFKCRYKLKIVNQLDIVRVRGDMISST